MEPYCDIVAAGAGLLATGRKSSVRRGVSKVVVRLPHQMNTAAVRYSGCYCISSARLEPFQPQPGPMRHLAQTLDLVEGSISAGDCALGRRKFVGSELFSVLFSIEDSHGLCEENEVMGASSRWGTVLRKLRHTVLPTMLCCWTIQYCIVPCTRDLYHLILAVSLAIRSSTRSSSSAQVQDSSKHWLCTYNLRESPRVF